MNEGKIFNFDSSLLEELTSNISIYRAKDIFSSFGLMKKSPKKDTRSRLLSNKKPGSYRFTRHLKTYVSRFIKNWIAIPDEFMTWTLPAILQGRRIVKQDNIDVIYSTAPPFSNHITAIFLKFLTKKPLVIDFRDAWVSNPIRDWKYPKLRQRIESLLEKIVISNSDLIVSTTEGMTQDFRTRYPQESITKFITITNGYDKDDSESSIEPNVTHADKMRVVYTGYLKMERCPKSFLEAVRSLLDEMPQLEDHIEVYFIGETSKFMDGKTIEDYIEQYKLQKIVTTTGYVARTEALMYQMSAHILLLIIGTVPKEKVFTYGIASKVYDYMLAEKPVLTLADKGPVSDLIESTKIGVVIEPSHIEGIKHYLAHCYNLFETGKLRLKTDQAEIAKYDVLRLTEKLTASFGACSHRSNVT
jgi:glycosyltransferase involved in cell wall biosynthesis